MSDVLSRGARKLLREWVEAWGSTKIKSYHDFYRDEPRLRMNLEAFAEFCVQKIKGDSMGVEDYFCKKCKKNLKIKSVYGAFEISCDCEMLPVSRLVRKVTKEELETKGWERMKK